MVSAPDELVNLGSNSVSNNDPSIICKHRINENGYYVIKAESFGSTSMFYLPDSLIEECNIAYIPILGYSSNLVLDNQLGLRLFSIGYGSSYNSTSIRGAIINGDTIGIVSVMTTSMFICTTHLVCALTRPVTRCSYHRNSLADSSLRPSRSPCPIHTTDRLFLFFGRTFNASRCFFPQGGWHRPPAAGYRAIARS